MKIGYTGLKQLCLVTWDLERAEKAWSKILGIEAEHVMTPYWKDVPSYTDGKPDTFHVEIIVFHLANDTLIEIFGPGEDDGNPWRTYLEKHGEGVMNIGLFVDGDRAEAYKQIGTVCENGIPYHEGFYPETTYTFVDTRKELGLELNVKRVEDNRAVIQKLKENPDSYSRDYDI